jgi:cell division protein FtsI/penicillin-binding protein 2
VRDTPVTAVELPPAVSRDLKPFRRVAFAQAFFLGVALLIVAQLVRWQVIQRRSLLTNMVAGNPYMQEIPPDRGMILDRNENLMALNNYDYSIEAAPRWIEGEEKERVAADLAALLQCPTAEIRAKIEGDAAWAPIVPRVPRELGKEIILQHFPGIYANPIAVRVYPETTLAAHVLGFVAGSDEGGTQGYYGVEGFYDDLLQGKTGLRNGQWDPWSPVSYADRRARNWTIPEDGRTLVLTLDRTIQYLVEQELRAAVERYGAESGSIVIIDPRTGALLASAGYPTYDPNQFAEAQDEVLVDPVIGLAYEPGSTFKVVTMAAALDTGAVQPGDLYNDIGYIEVGGRILRNWDDQAHGIVDMTGILVKSLNTGIAHVNTVLGPERFYQYVNRFGFGERTGIDLQGEVGGTTRQPGDPEWHESDLGTNAFGQGLAATPLQMVMAIGAVANDGIMMRPYVVESLIQNGQAIHAKHSPAGRVISEETARVLTEMMIQVVEQGTVMAQVEGYSIAGKTGTAQTTILGGYGYDPNLTIASFVGFAPADDPQFVALVKLDKPTASPYGATTAAPTFSRVARIMFTQLEIPPDAVRLAMN